VAHSEQPDENILSLNIADVFIDKRLSPGFKTSVSRNGAGL
jgi:hypothetical protein